MEERNNIMYVPFNVYNYHRIQQHQLIYPPYNMVWLPYDNIMTRFNVIINILDNTVLFRIIKIKVTNCANGFLYEGVP